MTGRYDVTPIADEALGVAAYALRDVQSGAEARVTPAVGNNLYSLTVPIGGEPLEAMSVPESGARRVIHFGSPILFPYPNRVRAGRFTFGGRTHQLDVNSPPHAIHGLVAGLPWRVESAGPTGNGARLAAYLLSEEHPEVARQFPFPFRIAVTYTLRGGTVTLEAEALNVGTGLLPLGFGIHPWFRLPLTPSGDGAACLVRVPASQRWELEPSLVPTGQVQPVAPEKDYRQLRPLGGGLDDVYTGLELAGGWSECLLRDPGAGAEVAVRADAAFREVVVYTPPGRPAICFEPYTCVTDALNLQARGVDAGLVELEPGQRWRGTISFTLRAVEGGRPRP